MIRANENPLVSLPFWPAIEPGWPVILTSEKRSGSENEFTMNAKTSAWCDDKNIYSRRNQRLSNDVKRSLPPGFCVFLCFRGTGKHMSNGNKTLTWLSMNSWLFHDRILKMVYFHPSSYSSPQQITQVKWSYSHLLQTLRSIYVPTLPVILLMAEIMRTS